MVYILIQLRLESIFIHETKDMNGRNMAHAIRDQ